MANPTAFISYSWDSDEHKRWVAILATKLRANGIDVKLDQWNAKLGIQMPAFMETQIRENDFVLIVCTPKYKLRSDGRVGGAGYEGDIMTAQVLTHRNHEKFVPVLANGKWTDSAPDWLLGKLYADLSTPEKYEQNYPLLWQTLTGSVPAPPPLGPLALLQQQVSQRGAQLSKEETEILIAAQKEGRLILLRADAFGTWLRADKTDFADMKDPAVAARYLDGLISLMNRGFARKEKSDYFVLTGAGFDIARKLMAAAKPASEETNPVSPNKESGRYISKNGLGVEVLVELPRIAYVGAIMKDFNFYLFSAFYQANQGKVDIGGFPTSEAAATEKIKLEAAFQTWANRPI